MTILSHIVNQYPNNYLKAIIFEINKRDKKKIVQEQTDIQKAALNYDHRSKVSTITLI